MSFNICVLGSGGREHSIYLHICKSEFAKKVFFAPGNAGVDTCFDVDPLNFSSVLKFVEQENIDIIIVGSEQPLVLGIKSYLQKNKPEVLIIGPSQEQAMLEGSKIFSFNFMKEHLIPQANGWVASSFLEAQNILDEYFQKKKIVLKVDGLAAGKGVSIHEEKKDAVIQLKKIFHDKIFGKAGSSVLIQSFIIGTEASLFAFCNGSKAIYLPTAQDYKKVYDGDNGPNTGGMGSFAPSISLSEEQISFVHQTITQKVLDKMKYRGILYIGLMLHSQDKEDLSVIEFNCRLGDPETQTILPLLESDLLLYFLWTEGKNPRVVPKVKKDIFYSVPFKVIYSINLVITAKGYPESYEKDIPLFFDVIQSKDLTLIHAGTKKKPTNQIVSSGGRIFNLVATAKDLRSARNLVYNYLELWIQRQPNKNRFHVRTDIAQDL